MAISTEPPLINVEDLHDVSSFPVDENGRPRVNSNQVPPGIIRWKTPLDNLLAVLGLADSFGVPLCHVLGDEGIERVFAYLVCLLDAVKSGQAEYAGNFYVTQEVHDRLYDLIREMLDRIVEQYGPQMNLIKPGKIPDTPEQDGGDIDDLLEDMGVLLEEGEQDASPSRSRVIL